MANQITKQIEKLAGKAQTSPSSKNIVEYLTAGKALACRVEAAQAVTGTITVCASLMDTIDSIIQIATPLVAISGDYELSTLLSSLKVWLDKKKAEKAQQEAQQNQMMSQGYDSLNFSYSF